MEESSPNIDLCAPCGQAYKSSAWHISPPADPGHSRCPENVVDEYYILLDPQMIPIPGDADPSSCSRDYGVHAEHSYQCVQHCIV